MFEYLMERLSPQRNRRRQEKERAAAAEQRAAEARDRKLREEEALIARSAYLSHEEQRNYWNALEKSARAFKSHYNDELKVELDLAFHDYITGRQITFNGWDKDANLVVKSKHYGLTEEQLAEKVQAAPNEVITPVFVAFIEDSYKKATPRHDTVIDLLLARGADPHAPYNKEHSIFEAAIWRDHHKWVQKMMDSPQFQMDKLNMTEAFGFLEFMNRPEYDALAKNLIRKGADISERNLRTGRLFLAERAIPYAQRMYEAVQDEPRVRAEEQKREWRAKAAEKRWEKNRDPERAAFGTTLRALRKKGPAGKSVAKTARKTLKEGGR